MDPGLRTSGPSHPTHGDHPEIAVLTLVALARSIVAYLFICLYVLIVGPFAILFALVFRSSTPLFVAARFAAAVALAVVGIRYRVARRCPPPPDGVVFCSNHDSNVDPPVLFLALHRRLHMLYKIEVDRIPILSTAMHIGGYVGIDRHDRQQSAQAITRAADLVRQGLTFLVYPEGTRSRTGELLPFKKGVFIMAIEAQAPVIPVAITGARDAMRKGSAIIRPVAVSVRIGAPVDTRGMTVDERDHLMAEVRSRIEGLLAEGPIS